MTNPDDVKAKFCNDLDNVIFATPRTYKLIFLATLMPEFFTDHQTCEGFIDTGVGKCNSNDFLLLRKCAEHDLLINNTVFRLPNSNKTFWMHPRSKHWHLIDYVIVRRKDRQDVRVTKTDHRLVIRKLNLRMKIKMRSFTSSEHIDEKKYGPYRVFGYSSLFSDPLDLATWSQRELQ